LVSVLQAFLFIRTSKSGPEAQLLFISMTIVTLGGRGEDQLFLLKITTNDGLINDKPNIFLKSIEIICLKSRLIVLIKKVCLFIQKLPTNGLVFISVFFYD